jgi:hypothetical protein
MGKLTFKGPVPKDDPLFSSGPEFFVRPGSKVEPVVDNPSNQVTQPPPDATWHTIFEGSGSLSGNDWFEDVCYLGQEQWLLSLYDDPAWSSDDQNAQEPEHHTSASLAAWVIDMDLVDADGFPRTEALLDVAIDVGATECVAVLRSLLDNQKGGV